MKDIEMEVNIAGERLRLTVPFPKQSAVRENESSLRALARELMERQPHSSDKQILAKLAYEFARRYNALKTMRFAELGQAEDLLREVKESLAEGEDEIEALSAFE